MSGSLVQYRERLNKWGFRKHGTKKQWEAIAKSVVIRGNLKESEAVLNGDLLISSKKLKKEIARKFTLSELARMKSQGAYFVPFVSPSRQLDVNTDFSTRIDSLLPPSPTLATVAVHSPMDELGFWPTFTSFCIPGELLNALPIRISDPEVVRVCQTAFFNQTRGLQLQESVIIKSRNFKDLRLLLYRLSNRLLDFEVISGILQRLKADDGYKTLKELISLNTISVKAACSNMLLFLVVRLESQLVELIHQHHPSVISSWSDKLNGIINFPIFRGVHGVPHWAEEKEFLQDLNEIKSFPPWNPNAVRFLLSCFSGTRVHIEGVYVRGNLWSLDSSLYGSPSMNGLLAPRRRPVEGLGTKQQRSFILNQSLRLGCKIEVNLLILRTLLLGSVQDAAVLLRSVMYYRTPTKIKGENYQLRVPALELGGWFWEDVSPFLDTYLTPKHLCHFICALIFLKRGTLLGFLLHYIQKRRTTKEKQIMEEYIKQVAFAEYWAAGCFKIYASTVPVRVLDKSSEDSITIFLSASTNLDTFYLGHRVELLRSFGNFLMSSAQFTRIYLQEVIPHKNSNREVYNKLLPHRNTRPKAPPYSSNTAHRLDDPNLPIATLCGGARMLIALLSPWEEDNNIFDSLFWLSSKSCKATCYGCSCTCNIDADLSNSTDSLFQPFTLRTFMCEVFSKGIHDIRKLDGRITLWDSAGRVPKRSNWAHLPPHRRPTPIGTPGPGFREIFEGFDWEAAIGNSNKKLFKLSQTRSNHENTMGRKKLFNEALSLYSWEIATGAIDENIRPTAEYIFDILEYIAYKAPQLLQIGTEWAKRLFRECNADIACRSNEDGLTPKGRKGRTLLQVAADWFNNVQILQLLVDEGADVNAPGSGDFGTALQSCCRRPSTLIAPGVTRINAVRFLVGAGANVNPEDPGGRRPRFRPLDGAVLTGDLAVARYLLEKGAYIDIDTITYAITYGRLDMVSLFVQFDSKFHDPALELARLHGETVIEEYLEGWRLGQPQGVPSEFVSFSLVEEVED
ncbi:hypothetical protein TWF281_008004 [Arthrobotrys megalospora]